MKFYYFKTEQYLPVSIDIAWQFFSSAKNLAIITPPELDFKILTPMDEMKQIHKGMKIDYIVHPLFSIPVRWTTQISHVNEPYEFVDTQLTGPYHTWIHTHRFTEKKDGLLMTDEVKYSLPYGILGRMVHSLLVRKQIEKIFDYRMNVLGKMDFTLIT